MNIRMDEQIRRMTGLLQDGHGNVENTTEWEDHGSRGGEMASTGRMVSKGFSFESGSTAR